VAGSPGIEQPGLGGGAIAQAVYFEMIYFARPDTYMHGESLYAYRLELGRFLAREHPIEADLVFGVPDSGIPAAIGYSQESGISYTEGLIKIAMWGALLFSLPRQCASLAFA
jgi:glutamine phosphoribosylpyrophosphate amidotransferase